MGFGIVVGKFAEVVGQLLDCCCCGMILPLIL